MLSLKRVDSTDNADLGFLYACLARRLDEPDTNISHTTMPSWDDHFRFVGSLSYLAYYIIMDDFIPKGNCYLTNRYEIGIYVWPEYRRGGIAKWAIEELMKEFGSRNHYIANIAPKNLASMSLFESLGFKREPQQIVFRKEQSS